MNLYICLILVLIILLFYYCNQNIDINNECIEYKIIKQKKIKSVDDEYNIKEFDVINDNIIIHNKFKNELLEYKTKKYAHEIKDIEKKNKEINQINQSIKSNSKIIQLEDLEKKNKEILQEIKYLKFNTKNEINDFIIDYKNNIATKDQAYIIISNLNKEVENIKKYIKTIDIKYHPAPLQKIQLINKKIRLYSKIIS